MARLFISFYLFVTLSLVMISTLLDAVWPEDSLEPTQEAQLLTHALASLENKLAVLEPFLTDNNVTYRIVPKSSIAWQEAELNDLAQGRVVNLYSESTHFLYAPIDQENLMVIALSQTEQASPYLFAYIGVFLLLLGCALAFWLWPLWRDLRQLTLAVGDFENGNSGDNLPTKLQLGQGSLMQPVASKLSELSQQVHRLINEQKELTGAVAHEFRTPIARLKFAIEMQSNNASIAFKGIQADLDELEGLVQEMLDYTHYDSVQPELNFAELPLLSLCLSQADKLSATTHKNINVEGIALSINGDGHFIERTINNLLSNAIRHANQSIRIHLEQDNFYHYVHVDDDGQGVPKSLREKVFDPFFRPDNSRTRYAGGAGLGLAIVKRIQDWHNADCLVGTSPLGGARFTLRYSRKLP